MVPLFAFIFLFLAIVLFFEMRRFFIQYTCTPCTNLEKIVCTSDQEDNDHEA